MLEVVGAPAPVIDDGLVQRTGTLTLRRYHFPSETARDSGGGHPRLHGDTTRGLLSRDSASGHVGFPALALLDVARRPRTTVTLDRPGPAAAAFTAAAAPEEFLRCSRKSS